MFSNDYICGFYAALDLTKKEIKRHQHNWKSMPNNIHAKDAMNALETLQMIMNNLPNQVEKIIEDRKLGFIHDLSRAMRALE